MDKDKDYNKETFKINNKEENKSLLNIKDQDVIIVDQIGDVDMTDFDR